MNTSEKRALTIREFCATFSVSRSFVYKQISAGKLVARKAGNRTLIMCDEADRWAVSLPGLGSVKDSHS